MLKNMSYSVIKFSENKKQYDADQKNDPRGDDKLMIIFKAPTVFQIQEKVALYLWDHHSKSRLRAKRARFFKTFFMKNITTKIDSHT